MLTREFDVSEAIRPNIQGSQNVVDAAIDRGVGEALLISTDKVVYPISLYGASKLAAEKLFVSANAYTRNRGTRLACARYGNVLGSRGSVAPLFLRQRATGTLTVTDPEMTRFMMTMEQGVRFMIRCVELMQGGEIFVPKVPSMRVTDLAKGIAPKARLKTIGRRVEKKFMKCYRPTMKSNRRGSIETNVSSWRPTGTTIPMVPGRMASRFRMDSSIRAREPIGGCPLTSSARWSKPTRRKSLRCVSL